MTRAELRAQQADEVAKMKDSPDEFHPNAKTAALYADIKAKRYVIGWLEEQERRFAALKEARGHDGLTSLEMCKREEVKNLLKQAFDELDDLEDARKELVE